MKPSASVMKEFHDKALKEPNMYDLPDHNNPKYREKEEKKNRKPPLSGILATTGPV